MFAAIHSPALRSRNVQRPSIRSLATMMWPVRWQNTAMSSSTIGSSALTCSVCPALISANALRVRKTGSGHSRSVASSDLSAASPGFIASLGVAHAVGMITLRQPGEPRLINRVARFSRQCSKSCGAGRLAEAASASRKTQVAHFLAKPDRGGSWANPEQDCGCHRNDA